MKFFIDVGHGGTESVAVGHVMIEKNIYLIVSLEVKRLLESYNQQVEISRIVDSTVSLGERCDLANRSKADYFVSIHHNANDGQTTGAEVYCSVRGGKGRDLANEVSAQFKSLGRQSRVIAKESEKTPGADYYYVLKNTNMPAIITEYGYMDSKDYVNFDTTDELKIEALAIVNACLKMSGVDTTKTVVVKNTHWAQAPFDFLKARGIIINETRFDDKITRGEIFALLAQIIK